MCEAVTSGGEGSTEEIQNGETHFGDHRHLRVYVCGLDDSGNLYFLAHRECRESALRTRGLGVGKRAGAASADGELFAARAEIGRRRRRREEGKEKRHGADDDECTAGSEPDSRRLSH